MTSPTPPPGWYADPSGQPGNRYWNGTNWEDAAAPAPSKRRRLNAWILGVTAALLAVLLTFAVIGDGGSDTADADAADATSAVAEPDETVTPAQPMNADESAPTVLSLPLNLAQGQHDDVLIDPHDVGEHIVDDVDRPRAVFDASNWRIVAQCENLVGRLLKVGVVKSDEYSAALDSGLGSQVSENSLEFLLDCPS